MKSFARPGGNIIGLANMYGDTTTKIVDVISTILPSARKIAILMSSNPTHPRLYEGITRGRAYCWTIDGSHCCGNSSRPGARVSGYMEGTVRCTVRPSRSNSAENCRSGQRSSDPQSIRSASLLKRMRCQVTVPAYRSYSGARRSMWIEYSKARFPLKCQSNNRPCLNWCLTSRLQSC